MDSGMNHIESMYLNYSGLLEEFSEDVIRSRYAFLYKECMEFLKSSADWAYYGSDGQVCDPSGNGGGWIYGFQSDL